MTIPIISYWTVSGWIMGAGGYPWVWTMKVDKFWFVDLLARA
jgi:hypothetical protein